MTVPQTTIQSALRATRAHRIDSHSRTKSPGALPVAIGIVLASIGIVLLGGGAWLIAHGGSPYYAISGAALIATGHLLVRLQRYAHESVCST